MNDQFDMIAWMKRWDQGNFSNAEKYDMLKRLFKFQLKRLEELQYDCLVPEKDKHVGELDSRSVYRLAKMKNKVIAKAMEIGKPGLVPFLPVLPRKIINTFHVIMQLYNSGENWYPSLQLNKVDMGKETSPYHVPYFIFNIDQGWETAGLSPQNGRNDILAKGFHPMNLAEALADQMHTNILKQLFIHACGSTYRENKKAVPDLYIDEQGNFGMKSGDVDKAKSGFVCPSYQDHMVAISWRGIISPKAWIRFKKRPKKQRVITPMNAE